MAHSTQLNWLSCAFSLLLHIAVARAKMKTSRISTATAAVDAVQFFSFRFAVVEIDFNFADAFGLSHRSQSRNFPFQNWALGVKFIGDSKSNIP